MKISERGLERLFVIGTLCALAVGFTIKGDIDGVKWIATTLVIYVLARRNRDIDAGTAHA